VEDSACVRPPASWSSLEPSTGYFLVFVRRGVFRRRVRGVETTQDPTVGYLEGPDDVQQIAHPVGDVDCRCTNISLRPGLLTEITHDDRFPTGQPVFTGGRLDLAHRLLVARARGGADAFELTERVVRLAAVMLSAGRGTPGPPRQVRPATAKAHRELTAAAREALAADPITLGLLELARRVGASPYHLSRVFRAETGQTLTRFRNRLRVRRALDRLEAGEAHLARLAAELGFADHAHLTRTMRQEVGHPPLHVRRMLAGRN
jgi:AraC-like DNA-binding protein